MASDAQNAPSETTGLLDPSNIEDDAAIDSVSTPASLDVGTRTLLLGVSALAILTTFAGNVSAFSEIDLIRSIACAEYHTFHGEPPPSHASCQIDAVDARYSDIMAGIASLNNIAACFCALFVFPFVIRKLGRKIAIVLGVLVLALERGFYTWLASATQFASGQGKLHPTTALHCILAQAFVFGIAGDSLLDMVIQAVVLDAVPAVLRSTWLARLQSCASIGTLASTLVVQMLNIDTSSDLIVDALPIHIGTTLALVNIVASLFVFFHVTNPPKCPLHANEPSEQMLSPNLNDRRVAKFKRAVRQAFRPLRLLFRPVHHRSEKPDWRLSRVLIANFLYGEIAVAMNMVLYYCQSRFHIHAKESSFLSGCLNICAWIYLSFGFQRIARWVRDHTVQTPQALEQYDSATRLNSIPAERWLTIGSLAMDIVSWTTFTLAGRAGSIPLFYLGSIVLSLSLGGPPSLTSLGSLLLPEGTENEELLAALFFINNAASTVGPMLNTRVYRFGLQIQFPELLFLSMATLSFISMMAVSSVRSNPA